MARASALLAFSLVAAPAAEAATVSLGGPSELARLAYVAAPGERNALVIDWSSMEAKVTLHDDGAVIVAPFVPCSQADPHTVVCSLTYDSFRPPNRYELLVELGDGDDALSFVDVQPDGHPDATTPVIADGGIGQDRLAATRGAQTLLGGPGDDALDGGPGGDVLDGGSGDDEIHGAQGDDVLSDGDDDSAAVPDLLDGGSGYDAVSYASRREGVSVDLEARRAAGGDALRSIEAAIGGDGDDRLSAENHSRSMVFGYQGSVLDGGPGRDRLIGRRGDDWLVPGEDGARISCGTGADATQDSSPYGPPGPGLGRYAHSSARVDAGTVLGPDCESLGFNPPLRVNPAGVGRSAIAFRVACPTQGEEGHHVRCSGALRVSRARRPRMLLARGRFRTGRWSDHRVRLPLTARGRHMLARETRVMATVRTTGAVFPHRQWTIALGRPR